MQNPFNDQSTQPDMSQYQFMKHFPLKERCMAKSMPGIYENPQLSKDAARRTQYFERILHFQGEMCVKR